MEIVKCKLTKEIILEKTLALVDKRNGIRSVTLRDIAKEVGCTHTNLYNYFDSLDDIFWEALGKVLNMIMDYTTYGFNAQNGSEKGVNLILANLIDFYMNHPGWYRLVWLDSLNGKPSVEVEAILHKPSIGFAELIRAEKGEIMEEDAHTTGEIMMHYLNGEMCALINGRSFVNDREQVKQKLLFNLKNLYRLLTQ
ncbi:TetR/AcrR family transcriptional regulator [Microbacteriaceae bacterium 4G12]